jgi:hypothetical protein
LVVGHALVAIGGYDQPGRLPVSMEKWTYDFANRTVCEALAVSKDALAIRRPIRQPSAPKTPGFPQMMITFPEQAGSRLKGRIVTRDTGHLHDQTGARRM